MVPTIKKHPTTRCSHDGRAPEGSWKSIGGLSENYRIPNQKFVLLKPTAKNDGLNFDNFLGLQLIVGKPQGSANQAPKRGGEATSSWFCSQHHTKQAQGHQIINHLVINW